jgi:hypothetical protein
VFEKPRWCVFCNGEHARSESCEERARHERDRDRRAHHFGRDRRLAAARRQDLPGPTGERRRSA